jgi:hypothetical protein
MPTPVARAGLATNPVKKRNARIVEKFLAVTMGTLKRTKIASVMMYTGLRPSDGSSWSGVKNIGPMPYAIT